VAGPRSPRHPAEISYDPALGVLTVSLGDALATDSDEPVDGFYTVFDASTLGRLVSLQALLPPDPPGTWRLLLADHLGQTLAARCLAWVDAEDHAVGLASAVPGREWRNLRHIQWPALHQACRSRWGMPPLPPVQAPSTWAGTFLAATTPAADGPEGAPHARLDLPAAVTHAGEVDGPLTVTVAHDVVRLEISAHWKPTAGGLAASVLSPEPRSAAPARFRMEGARAAVEVPLVEPPSPGATILVHVEADTSPGTTILRSFVLRIGARASALREYLGVREPVTAGTTYGSTHMGRLHDRIFWQQSRKAPVEVVILREGRTLWARGHAGSSKRRHPVAVRCVLRADAHTALGPEGLDSPGGVLSAEGTVAADGSFQLKLAQVSGATFRGELVDRLELDIG